MSLCVALSASLSMAQSLGDVARQERARQSQLTQHAPVVTNDDLHQERILHAVKADDPPAVSQASAEETISAASAPVLPPSVAWVSANTPRWEVADQPGFSLGAYARALRIERSRREHGNVIMKQSLQKITNETVAEMLPPTGEVKRSEENHQPRIQPGPTNQIEVANAESPEPKQQTSQMTQPGQPLIRASRGDSLWKLARVHLGDGRLWPMLWESNPEIRNPQRLVVGQLLRLPVQELNFARVRNVNNQVKLVSAKRNTVQPVSTPSGQSTPVKVSVQAFDVVRYLPARLSTWAVAGLLTFVNPSA